MLKASCLMLEINEFRCYEAQTEPRQLDNHQPSQSSIKFMLLPLHLSSFARDSNYNYSICSCTIVVWLSGRALAAQARSVLGLTPGDCRLITLLYLHLITSKFIY